MYMKDITTTYVSGYCSMSFYSSRLSSMYNYKTVVAKLQEQSV